jgi:sigma-E factor negative regulatory protein RseB
MRLILVSFHLFNLLLLGLMARPALADTDPLVDRREAYAWLKKIQSAAQKINYTGTFIYQEINQVHTSRIAHQQDGKNELQKLEILDGKPREYVRNNDEIICYLPEARLMLVEKKATTDLFPSVLPANFADQASNYNIKNGEAGRVAGFDCHALVLEPKDKWRYGYKLCAEKSTGLLLRAQTMNEHNEVVEQIAFTQLTLGDVERSRLKSSFVNLAGWRVENAMISQVPLNDWQVRWVPPGFKKTREMKRLLSDTSPLNPTGSQREVSQIVFSDGLAAISIFIEPVTPNRVEGWMQNGAMNIIGKRHGDFWLTIIGEVPAGALKQVVNSIEYKPK